MAELKSATILSSLNVIGSTYLNADVLIKGNLSITGQNNIINTETVTSKDQLIELGAGRTTALTSPAGFYVPKYDGTNSGALVFDSTGTAYVGDVVLDANNEIDLTSSQTTLQPLATRPKTVTNGSVMVWNNEQQQLVEASNLSDISYVPKTYNGNDNTQIEIVEEPTGVFKIQASGGIYLKPTYSSTNTNSGISLWNDHLSPNSNNKIDLGKSDSKFKNAYFAGTVTASTFSGNLNGTATKAKDIEFGDLIDENVGEYAVPLYDIFGDSKWHITDQLEPTVVVKYAALTGTFIAPNFSGNLLGNATTATDLNGTVKTSNGTIILYANSNNITIQPDASLSSSFTLSLPKAAGTLARIEDIETYGENYIINGANNKAISVTSSRADFNLTNGMMVLTNYSSINYPKEFALYGRNYNNYATNILYYYAGSQNSYLNIGGNHASGFNRINFYANKDGYQNSETSHSSSNLVFNYDSSQVTFNVPIYESNTNIKDIYMNELEKSGSGTIVTGLSYNQGKLSYTLGTDSDSKVEQAKYTTAKDIFAPLIFTNTSVDNEANINTIATSTNKVQYTDKIYANPNKGIIYATTFNGTATKVNLSVFEANTNYQVVLSGGKSGSQALGAGEPGTISESNALQFNPYTGTLSVYKVQLVPYINASTGEEIYGKFIGDVQGNLYGNASTATRASTITVSNTTSDTNYQVPFFTNSLNIGTNSASLGFSVAGTAKQLLFNPSTGTVTAELFKGNLEGNASTATTASTAGTATHLGGGDTYQIPYQFKDASNSITTKYLSAWLNTEEIKTNKAASEKLLILSQDNALPTWQTNPFLKTSGGTMTGTLNVQNIVANASRTVNVNDSNSGVFNAGKDNIYNIGSIFLAATSSKNSINFLTSSGTADTLYVKDNKLYFEGNRTLGSAFNGSQLLSHGDVFNTSNVIPVSKGGTGVNTFTENAILIGDGNNPISTIEPSSGLLRYSVNTIENKEVGTYSFGSITTNDISDFNAYSEHIQNTNIHIPTVDANTNLNEKFLTANIDNEPVWSSNTFKDTAENVIQNYNKQNNIVLSKTLSVGTVGTNPDGTPSYDDVLNVAGNAVIENNLQVNGTAYISEGLTVMGNGISVPKIEAGDISAEGIFSKYAKIGPDYAAGATIHTTFENTGHAEFDNDVYVSGNLSVSKDLTITGNLNIQGTTTTINTTTLSSKDQLIELGAGRTTALTSPAGFYVPKYDGTNSGALVFDSTGTAYVGDVTVSNGAITVSTSLQAIATRNLSNSDNNKILVWDSVNQTIKAAACLKIIDNILYSSKGITLSTGSVCPNNNGISFYNASNNWGASLSTNDSGSFGINASGNIYLRPQYTTYATKGLNIVGTETGTAIISRGDDLILESCTNASASIQINSASGIHLKSNGANSLIIKRSSAVAANLVHIISDPDTGIVTTSKYSENITSHLINATSSTNPLEIRSSSGIYLRANGTNLAQNNGLSIVNSGVLLHGHLMPNATSAFMIGSDTHKFTYIYANNFVGKLIGKANSATYAENVSTTATKSNTNYFVPLIYPIADASNASGTVTASKTVYVAASNSNKLLYNPCTGTLTSELFNGTATEVQVTTQNYNVRHHIPLLYPISSNSTTGKVTNGKTLYVATDNKGLFYNPSQQLLELEGSFSASGNITAPTFTGDLVGNASTATKSSMAYRLSASRETVASDVDSFFINGFSPVDGINKTSLINYATQSVGFYNVLSYSTDSITVKLYTENDENEDTGIITNVITDKNISAYNDRVKSITIKANDKEIKSTSTLDSPDVTLDITEIVPNASDLSDGLVTLKTKQNIPENKSFSNGITLNEQEATNKDPDNIRYSATNSCKIKYNKTKQCVQFIFA